MFKIYLSFVEPGDQYLGCSLAGLDPNKSEFVADNFKDFTGWKIMIHFIAIFLLNFSPKKWAWWQAPFLELATGYFQYFLQKRGLDFPFCPLLGLAAKWGGGYSHVNRGITLPL